MKNFPLISLRMNHLMLYNIPLNGCAIIYLTIPFVDYYLLCFQLSSTINNVTLCPFLYSGLLP